MPVHTKVAGRRNDGRGRRNGHCTATGGVFGGKKVHTKSAQKFRRGTYDFWNVSGRRFWGQKNAKKC